MTQATLQSVRLSTRAAGRIRLNRVVASAGRGLVVGGLLGCAAVVASKLAPLDTAAAGIAGGAVVVVSVLAAAGLALLRRVTPSEGAGRLDEALRLRDRLTTAVELAGRSTRSLFAELALADAEGVAGDVDPARAVPLRANAREWGAGLAAVALAAAVLFVAPARTVTDPAMVASSTPEEREAARERIEAAAESLSPPPGTDQSPATAVSDELKSIEERLERGELDAEDALAAAAEELERAAAETEAESRTAAETERALSEAASEVETGEELEELKESLAEADLERAREAARRLMEKKNEMPPEARERLARDLEKLSDALEESAAEPEPQGGPDDRLRDELRDRVGDLTDEDRVAEELEREGVDPASARDLAERIAREERDERRREQTREDVERLREALDRTAEEVREPREPTPPEPEPTGDERDPADPGAGEPPAERPGEQEPPPEQPERQPGQQPEERSPQGEQQKQEQEPLQDGGEQSQSGSQKDETQREAGREGSPPPGATDPTENAPGKESDQGKPSEPGPQEKQPQGQNEGEGEGRQPSQRPEQEPGRQPGEQPGEQPGQQPGEQPGQQGEGGEQPETQPGEQPGEQTGEQPGGQPGEQPGSQPGQQPGDQPGTQPGEQPGQQPGDPSGRQTGEPSDRPGSGQRPGRGTGNLEDELQRLAERQKQRQTDERRAAEMRRKAQELLDDATPEERERLEDWAEKLAEQNRLRDRSAEPWDADERPVDARQRDPADQNEQVLAEWYNPEGEPAQGVERGGASSDRLREAVESAENAVEQQRVPPRYRKLVREVFKKMQDRAAEREGAAPLGEDAGKPTPEPAEEPGGDG